MRPYLDKAAPGVWQAATAYSAAVQQAATDGGLSPVEAELIKVRASQLNGCAFCLDKHSRDARAAGVTPQQLDLLPAWRESALFTERQRAALAVTEAATRLPLTEQSRVELSDARTVLGEDGFVATEWVAITINTFNRVSILSEHPVRARDVEGRLVRAAATRRAEETTDPENPTQ